MCGSIVRSSVFRAAAIGLAILAGGSGAVASDVTLRYSSWVPLDFWINRDVLYPWFEQIEEVTEGRVKVEVLPMTVGTAASQYDVVLDGLADVAFIIPSYTPGRFVLSEMGELPGLSSDGGVNARAFDEAYREHLAQHNEFGAVQVMGVWSTVPLTPLNNARPLRSAEDFNGIKLRTPVTNLVTILSALGGVPIQQSGPESYQMLSTGTIDGQISQVDSAVAFNAVELMRYATVIPGGMGNAVQMVAINEDAWQRISEEDRQKIEEITTGHLAAAFGDGYQRREQAGFEALVEAGYQIDEADDALVEDLAKVFAPIEEAWIERAKAKGLADPAAVLADLRARIERLSASR